MKIFGFFLEISQITLTVALTTAISESSNFSMTLLKFNLKLSGYCKNILYIANIAFFLIYGLE